MATKKRGQNEGNVRKRPDGRWEARLNLGWQGGKRVRKSFYGTTREEVARQLAGAKTQHDSGQPVPHGHDTVADFLASWLATVRHTVRPRTWESYELYMRRHAIPIIGRTRLNALRPEHIRSLLQQKLNEGLSAQSAIHLRTILNTAFNQAVQDKLLAWNPVSSVKRPKARRPNYQTLSRDQAKIFLTAAADSRFGAMFAVSAALGLRRGEATGLRWSDIDLEARTLRVEQTIQRVRKKIAGHTGFIIAEPKTERSRRTLGLPNLLIPILRRQRARQAQDRLLSGTRWQESGLTFTNTNGGPLDPGVLGDEFKATLKRAGLPHMHFQDLRHSAASLLLAKGAPLRLVMEILGHSTITLTANTYGHIAPEAIADAADKMDAILGG